MTLKLRILRSLTRLFIILVSLMRSLFSEKCLFPIDALVVWCSTWSKNLGRSLLNTHLISDVEDFRWNPFSWGSWDSKNFFRFFTVCVRAPAACCDDNRFFSVAWNMIGIHEFTKNFDNARLFLCVLTYIEMTY